MRAIFLGVLSVGLLGLRFEYFLELIQWKKCCIDGFLVVLVLLLVCCGSVCFPCVCILQLTAGVVASGQGEEQGAV